MGSRGGARPIGNAALMRRVKVIESLLPEKTDEIDANTGRKRGYNSPRYQHIEELIAICRSIRAPSSNVEELYDTISTLRTEVRHRKQLHSQLKVSNHKLRIKVALLNKLWGRDAPTQEHTKEKA